MFAWPNPQNIRGEPCIFPFCLPSHVGIAYGVFHTENPISVLDIPLIWESDMGYTLWDIPFGISDMAYPSREGNGHGNQTLYD